MAGADRYRLAAAEARRVAMVEGRTDDEQGNRAARFRSLALPCLDDVYSLARYLTGNAADADDATQECYLRAFRHFDGFQGPAIKPWLFAILRNVCHASRARAGQTVPSADPVGETGSGDPMPLWSEAPLTPEAELLRQYDADTIRGLVAALPYQFREVIVLREISGMAYRDIAAIADIPIGTVMSRLARARLMLRNGWLAAEHAEAAK